LFEDCCFVSRRSGAAPELRWPAAENSLVSDHLCGAAQQHPWDNTMHSLKAYLALLDIHIVC